MRVAITGGAGFVGAAIARTLVGAGAEVCAIDLAAFDRLAAVDGHPRLRKVRADVRDGAAIAEAIDGAALVLHLAAVVGVKRYLADPAAVVSVNVGGTQAVVAACAARGTALVMASTSEVYGALGVDLREDGPVQFGDLHNPRWSYALSKAAAEQVVLAAARGGLPALVVRYFNVYGPELDAPGEGRVVSQFLGALRNGVPLSLVDGGLAVRSLCYIDDAVEATLRLARRLRDPGGPTGLVVNVGRREPVTMADLAAHMLRLSASPVGTRVVDGLHHFGPGFEEIPRRVPVLDRLTRLAGYTAPTSLDAGLRKVLAAWGLLSSQPPAAPTPPVAFVVPQVAPDGAVVAAIGRALTSGRLTNGGPHVFALEAELAGRSTHRHVVATSSGFGALVIALAVTRPADPARTVAVLPAFTFAATRNAVIAAGLTPLYADIDPATWTLDPQAVARAVAGRHDVAAIVAVTVFGVPPPIADLAPIARSAGCALVVDDAHGLGSGSGETRCDPAGATAIAWSMHATKLVVAAEGGAVAFHSAAEAELARALANHGIAAGGEILAMGWNFKLSEVHAAIARHSLASLDARVDRRRALDQRLRGALRRCGALTLQRVPAGVTTNGQSFGVLAADPRQRDGLIAHLGAAGIEARRYFASPLAEGPALPVTADVAARVLCLPIHDAVPLHAADIIARQVRSFLTQEAS